MKSSKRKEVKTGEAKSNPDDRLSGRGKTAKARFRKRTSKSSSYGWKTQN